LEKPYKSADEVGELIDSLSYEKVIYYDLPVSMIKEVILDPRASKYDTEMFIAYCTNRKFTDDNIGFRKSDLYKLPVNKY